MLVPIPRHQVRKKARVDAQNLNLKPVANSTEQNSNASGVAVNCNLVEVASSSQGFCVILAAKDTACETINGTIYNKVILDQQPEAGAARSSQQGRSDPLRSLSTLTLRDPGN